MNFKKKFPRLTIIAVILGILLALQIKSINVNTVSSKDYAEMEKNILSYVQKNAELNQRNNELYAQIEAMVKDKDEGNLTHRAIIEERERIARFAGLRAVRNSGIVITVKNPALISDFVLRLLTNELNALGAQAISINDQRRVATTEIRMTNQNIIINGVGFPRGEEFVIKAITPKDQEAYILSSLRTLAKTIRSTQDVQGNFEISIEPSESVLIPALNEDSTALKMELLNPVEEN